MRQSIRVAYHSAIVYRVTGEIRTGNKGAVLHVEAESNVIRKDKDHIMDSEGEDHFSCSVLSTYTGG